MTEIKQAIIRYYKAVDKVNEDMLIEYCLECAGLPWNPVSGKDARMVRKCLRELKNSGDV